MIYYSVKTIILFIKILLQLIKSFLQFIKALLQVVFWALNNLWQVHESYGFGFGIFNDFVTRIGTLL